MAPAVLSAGDCSAVSQYVPGAHTQEVSTYCSVQDLDLRTLSACDKQPGVYS
jgi:hypothetical protein